MSAASPTTADQPLDWEPGQDKHGQYCGMQGPHSAGHGRRGSCTCGRDALVAEVAVLRVRAAAADTLADALREIAAGHPGDVPLIEAVEWMGETARAALAAYAAATTETEQRRTEMQAAEHALAVAADAYVWNRSYTGWRQLVDARGAWQSAVGRYRLAAATTQTKDGT